MTSTDLIGGTTCRKSYCSLISSPVELSLKTATRLSFSIQLIVLPKLLSIFRSSQIELRESENFWQAANRTGVAETNFV